MLLGRAPCAPEDRQNLALRWLAGWPRPLDLHSLVCMRSACADTSNTLGLLSLACIRLPLGSSSSAKQLVSIACIGRPWGAPSNAERLMSLPRWAYSSRATGELSLAWCCARQACSSALVPLCALHSPAASLGGRLRARKGRRGQLLLGDLAAAGQRQAWDEHQACRHSCSRQALSAPAQQGLLQVGTAILLLRLRGGRPGLCWHNISHQAHACR